MWRDEFILLWGALVLHLIFPCTLYTNIEIYKKSLNLFRHPYFLTWYRSPFPETTLPNAPTAKQIHPTAQQCSPECLISVWPNGHVTWPIFIEVLIEFCTITFTQ